MKYIYEQYDWGEIEAGLETPAHSAVVGFSFDRECVAKGLQIIIRNKRDLGGDLVIDVDLRDATVTVKREDADNPDSLVEMDISHDGLKTLYVEQQKTLADEVEKLNFKVE